MIKIPFITSQIISDNAVFQTFWTSKIAAQLIFNIDHDKHMFCSINIIMFQEEGPFQNGSSLGGLGIKKQLREQHVDE